MRLLVDLLVDVRGAVRAMRRAPIFPVVTILTVALGIGANTAIFSVLYSVWLAPVPYADADRLVAIDWREMSGRGFSRGASYPELEDWRAGVRSVGEFGTHRYVHEVNVAGDQGAEEVVGHRVSANLFGLLGARPVLGNALDAAADRSTGPRQALISYSWWMRRFGGAAEAIGQTIRVNGESVEITGVMPERFAFPPMAQANARPALWLSQNTPSETLRDVSAHAVAVIARMHRGVSPRQVQEELSALEARPGPRLPGEAGWQIRVSRLNEVGQLEETRPGLLLLMGAAALVLLIACANIANLVLARAFGRDREMETRRALGATWNRLARQVLTESVLLAITGGAAGVLLAYWTVPILRTALPTGMPRADEITVNAPVLWFATGISLVTGLLFGLLPASRWGEPRDGQNGRGKPMRSGAMRTLVTVEIGIAMMLLAAAGLLAESFQRVAKVDLGFRKENVLTLRVQLTKSRYPDGARVADFRADLLRRAGALPAVIYAGTVSSLPMGSVMQGTEFVIAGRPETSDEKPFLDFASVSGDYFGAMGIPLVAGRVFDSRDRPEADPVVLISEAGARTHWKDGAALGSRIRFDNTWFIVVGIVKDVRQYSPERGARGGTLYALNEQLPAGTQRKDIGRLVVLVIRTAHAAAPLAAAMRKAVADIDKEQPSAEVVSMEQLVWQSTARRRVNTLLLGLFAGIALLLAASGVFGVTFYSVARRTREIGIRVALGATPSAVLLLVGKETLLVAGRGILFGAAGAMAASRFLARFLYGIGPEDPRVLAAVVLVLAGILVAAGLFPARRALRVDPMQALREE